MLGRIWKALWLWGASPLRLPHVFTNQEALLSHVPDARVFRNIGTIAQIMWYERLQPLLSRRPEAEASSPLTPAGVLETSPHPKVPIPLLQEPSHLHSRYPITGEMPRSCEALDSRLESWLYWNLQLKSTWL